MGLARFSEEATMGFEPMIKVLQTSALPLGHVAKKMLIVDWRSLIFTIHNLQPSISNSESGRRDSNPWPSPWQGDVIPLNYARKFRSAPTANRECREPESNWRHHNFQSCALPTELSRPESTFSQTQARFYTRHFGLSSNGRKTMSDFFWIKFICAFKLTLSQGHAIIQSRQILCCSLKYRIRNRKESRPRSQIILQSFIFHYSGFSPLS